MSAGLDHARGDAVIVIDADLQDPPELIPDMVRAWQAGSDVVRMRRASRASESWLKKATAGAFYRAIGRIGEIDIPADVGDFRLLSRRAVAALLRFPERSRFMKGLFAWIGFPSAEIVYHRDGRFAGDSKWNYWRLWNLALEGITRSRSDRSRWRVTSASRPPPSRSATASSSSARRCSTGSRCVAIRR